MLRTYPNNGLTVEISASQGYAFQLSNSLSQIASKDSLFSKIDLGKCEKDIKEHYGLDQNISLIFFKFENIGDSKNERKIQYEVYNPLNYEELNISICQESKIELILSIELSDALKEIIQNILDQGYDPLDENGKFYREICTPYNSENGTDVLLDDREEYIYSSIKSEMTCPSGCEMISYSLDDKYISCECDTNGTGIIELDYQNLNLKNVEDSFLSTFKNSNYKVMRCYNLVFNFKIFCHNYGSIITLIFFIIYVAFMIYYCCKDITPLKVSISKLLFDEQQKFEMNLKTAKRFIFDIKSAKNAKSVKSEKSKSKKSTKNKKKQNKNTKVNNPPRRLRLKKDKNNSFEKTKVNEDIKLIDLLKKKRRSVKNKKQPDQESVKSDKVRKRKSIIDYQNEIVIKTREQLIKQDIIGEKPIDDGQNTHSSKKLKDGNEKVSDQKNKYENV